MLSGNDRPTNAADVYAFAICCLEILGMGELPWPTLDDKAIRELVMGKCTHFDQYDADDDCGVDVDKNERPPIPMLAEYDDVANAVANLVRSCWVRDADRRPLFSSIAASLEEVWTLHVHGSPQICNSSLSSINIGSAPVTSTDSSPADEHYETASESMRTEVEEESMNCMMDVSLTSPVPTLGNGRSVLHVDASTHTEVVKVLTKVTSGTFEDQDNNTTTPSPTNKLDVDARNEENYRLIAGSNHAFHNSCEFVPPESI